MIILAIFFWISVFAILHSYLFFPVILQLIVKRKHYKNRNKSHIEKGQQNFPFVHILIAAYNEEKVIGAKLESILRNDYPLNKYKIWIGSDASTDHTDDIILMYQNKYPQNIGFRWFSGRNGKSNILNALHEEIQSSYDLSEALYLPTDANVIFKEDTIKELAIPFSDSKVGLVGAFILNKEVTSEGISFQEKSYIQRENYIKYLESEAWGTMIGAFGACYSIRARLFTPIPANFLMEDFYLTMQVFEKRLKAISSMKAICYEDVSNKVSEEFKRKIRISAGNFQNLSRFYKLLWPPFSPIGFSFLSHKVLRWLGPLFLIIAFITSALLSGWNEIYEAMFISQVILLLLALLDFLLKKVRINFFILRFVSYFYAMNLALLIGFFKYLNGIKTNVWKPTERNQ